MKKFLASVASVAMIGSATAQGIPGPEQGREMGKDGWYMPNSGLRVVCNSADKVMDFVQKQHGEQVVFTGLSQVGQNQAGWILAVNPEKSGWTIMVMDGKRACIISSGTDATAYEIDSSKAAESGSKTSKHGL